MGLTAEGMELSVKKNIRKKTEHIWHMYSHKTDKSRMTRIQIQ